MSLELVQGMGLVLDDMLDRFDALIRRAKEEGPQIVEAVNTTTGIRSREYGRARRTFQATVRSILTRVKAGELATPMAASLFADAYATAASTAYGIGYSAGGGTTLTMATTGWVENEVTAQTDLFASFLDDVRKDDVLFSGGDKGRADLYVNHLDSVKNQGFADARASEDVLWWWVLGDHESCDDCLSLSLASPYRGEAPAVPKGDATVCGSNCKCRLVAEPAARREAKNLRSAEDAIARARYARLSNQPDALDEEARALQVCEEARYDPFRAADLLWGSVRLDEHALSADSIRAAGRLK